MWDKKEAIEPSFINSRSFSILTKFYFLLFFQLILYVSRSTEEIMVLYVKRLFGSNLIINFQPNDVIPLKGIRIQVSSVGPRNIENFLFVTSCKVQLASQVMITIVLIKIRFIYWLTDWRYKLILFNYHYLLERH